MPVSFPEPGAARKLGRVPATGIMRTLQVGIRHFLELGVSKTAIAKITGVSRTALYSFMTTKRAPGRRP